MLSLYKVCWTINCQQGALISKSLLASRMTLLQTAQNPGINLSHVTLNRKANSLIIFEIFRNTNPGLLSVSDGDTQLFEEDINGDHALHSGQRADQTRHF